MSSQGDPQETFQEIKANEDNKIYFTYTVKWKESDVRLKLNYITFKKCFRYFYNAQTHYLQ